MSANEQIERVASNPQQGVAHFAPVPVPVSKKGVFYDGLFFGFPGPPAPVPGQFIKNKQWINVFTKAAAYPNLRINCIDQEFDDETITDVTSTPDATCE